MDRSKRLRTLLVLLLLPFLPFAACQRAAGPNSSGIATTPHAIYLPEIAEGAASVVATPSPPAVSREGSREPGAALPPPVPKPDYGVQIHIPPRWDVEQTLADARGLGVGWVKQQVQWHTIEHGPGDLEWETLDRIVEAADSLGFKVLLSVTHAPDWTRSMEGGSGPPSDYAEFGRFMEEMARRYQGRVDAYELWNEPNLAREWRGDTLDPAGFVNLVGEGAAGVRAGDSQALVISGAPAVTGINDGETAISDRVFFREMLSAGIARHVDAVGAHPYGYGNPPWESVQDESHVGSSHNDHPSFFFRDTLEDYRRIMVDNGADAVPIWVTEFGWPSPEGIGQMDLTGWEYGREVGEDEQAEYIVQAFYMGDERSWVGPMFLWNLNLAEIWGSENAFSAYSLLRPDGSYRPSYVALRLAQPAAPRNKAP